MPDRARIEIHNADDLVFGAGIWHFATYVDRYATDGYGEPRTVLDAIELAGRVEDLSVVDLNWPFPPASAGIGTAEVKDALAAHDLRAIALSHRG